ncbi:hypothetical protein AaE_003667 [Aphanomyces astaci]|uniref:EGF-like domain-containing protein n=1 Tax=Aphanomyces astaci TaxID=112090 RepID=A0A6A5AT95_APHAT|nr:hypothetical protein AaE_003667 [Aphanomyces astaci]
MPVEQLMYDGNIGLEVNTEKCVWLQGEIKRMVDEGHLTKAEKDEVIATLQQNLEHIAEDVDASSGKKKDKLLEKQATIQARLALVESHKANVVYRLRKSAEIVKLRVELLGVVAWLFIIIVMAGGAYVVVPSQRNQDFACCGGCSSGVRANAALLPLGSRIVLWDATVKVAPADQCQITFPFEPTNGELPGSRRVRSGKLVGSTFPLDHDADALCCLNNGRCSLSEDDASGRCDCVVQYGFQGAFCELSVYDVAATNNSLLYPPTFEPPPFTIPLPDVRHALELFPIAQPLLKSLLASTAATTDGSTGSEDPSLAQYRERAFLPAALGVAAAMGLACVFLLVLLVKCCLISRVYSMCEKIVTMLLMLAFALLSAASLGVGGNQWLQLHHQSTSLTTLVDVALPSALDHFYTAMSAPLLAALQGNNGSIPIPMFQLKTAALMQQYARLNQTDMPGLFLQALDPLKTVGALFPTATGCENVVILRSSISVMTVGAATGCFQCPKCAAIVANVQQIKLDWFRGVQAIHFILYQSHKNLVEFSTVPLEPTLQSFQRSLNYTKSTVGLHVQRLSGMLASLTTSFAQLLDYGLYLWWPASFLTTSTSIVAAIVGLKYKSGIIGKGASWLAQLSTLLGFGLTGVTWSLAYCARDGIELLQSFDMNATVLIPDVTPAIGLKYTNDDPTD